MPSASSLPPAEDGDVPLAEESTPDREVGNGMHSAANRYGQRSTGRREEAVMTTSGPNGGRRRRFLVPAIALGLAALVGWLLFVGVTWRGPVPVFAAESRQPDRLALIVDSCQANPEVSLLRESSKKVEVEVIATKTFRLRGGGNDCQDLVEVQLREPLGDRTVVDLHSGKAVSVTEIEAPSG